jgi:TatD DNase family protein
MTITDTHTHLYSEEFDQDRDEMIQRALNKVFPVFLSRNRLSSYTQAMYDLEKNYPEHVFLMMAASYPCKGELFRGITTCREEAAKRKFYAIGEIGIDLYWDKTYLLEQQIAFRKQIQLAKQYKLPL